MSETKKAAKKEVGQVITDINAMSHEEMSKLQSAPDFHENKVLQEIVAKWKKVHLSIE